VTFSPDSTIPLNVLYVEDSHLDAELLERVFNRHAPHVTLDHVSTFKEAEARLFRSTPEHPLYDLILTDMMLPDGNGMSLISLLRERGLPIALVVVTGLGNEDAAIAALKAGASDYVSKRGDYLSRLPEILEKALRRFREEMHTRSRALNILYGERHAEDIASTLRYLGVHAPFIHFDTVATASEMLKRLPESPEDERVPANRYDLLLVDYDLPDMNGMQIIKEVLEFRKLDIPIVVVTGRGDEDVAIQTIRLGAMDYVIKNEDYLHHLPWILENAVNRTRLRREHELLRENEEHVRALLENASDIIVELDPDLVIRYASPSLRYVLGLEAPDLMGVGFLHYIHEDDRAVAREAVEWAVNNPGSVTTLIETRFVYKDGSWRHMEWLCKSFAGKSGRITAVVNGRDITAKKATEEELRLDEGRLESLLKITRYRTDDVDQLLYLSLEEAIALTKSKIGYVYCYDETRKEYILNTWSKDVMKGGTEANSQIIQELENAGIWSEAVRRGKPIVLNDFQTFHSLKKGHQGHPERHPHLYRFLTIPVIIKDRIVAVVGVANKPEDYDQSDVRQLTLLMDSVWQFVELKSVDERLKRAAEAWRATFDSITDSIMILSPDGSIVRINRATEGFFGLPMEKILGGGCCRLVHGAEEPPEACPLRKTATSKMHEEAEFYLAHKDMWVTVSVDPIFDQKGDVVNVVHIMRDITNRKNAENALRESENKFRDFSEKANVGVYLLQDRIFRYVNARFAEIHGYTVEEMTDKLGTLETTLPEDEKLVHENIRRRDAGEMDHVRAEFRILTKDKQVKTVEIYGGRTMYQGRPAIVGSLLDITDRKRTDQKVKDFIVELGAKNRELGRAYSDLKESQKKIIQQEKLASIGQLAAGVAHEINNPMGFITSNLNSLKKYMTRIPEFIRTQTEAVEKLAGERDCKGDSVVGRVAERRRSLKIDYLLEDAGSLISESLDGAYRIARIVKDLKNFSRIDEIGFKPADINEGIESTLNIVWNELKYKATVRKEYGEIPFTSCNLGQLNQVFMNLLVNAAHAIVDKGEIAIRTWHDDAFIYVSVADTGVGIPEGRLARIFEPFYTTKEVGKGTGLGLSIANDIIVKHNGTIEVASKVGEGTTFTLKIPIVEG
jgi:PAS domain S-box-containing protein